MHLGHIVLLSVFDCAINIITQIQDFVAFFYFYTIIWTLSNIAIPPLGAGLGNLEWPLVKSKIELILCGLEDVDIFVYEPKGAPESAPQNLFEE